MNKKIYSCLLATLSLVWLLASCSGTPKYANMIPDDAAIVVRIDAKQIAEKSGTADNQELKDLMNRLLRDANMSRALQDKVEAVVADPAEAGIDLREPLFVFGSQSFEGHVGLIGAIHSRDKLTELLDALAKDAGADRCIERDGYTYFELDGEPIVFNDDWFMLTNKSYDQDESDVIAEVSKRFEADEENSIRSNEAFKELCKSEGDVQLLLLGKGLAEIDGMRRELQDIEKQLPSGVRIDDYALVADLNLGDGEATLSTRAIALTDEARNFMDENAKGLSAVEGDMLKYVPASTLLAAATHLDGKAVLDKAKEQGLLRNANPEAAKIVTDVFEALDGDITVSLDSFNEMGMPAYSAYAEVKNATFLRNLMRDFLDSGYATENATDQYQVTLDSYTEGYFGVKNGTFYFSTDSNAPALRSASPAVDADDYKGKLFFMRLYPQNVLKLAFLSPMLDGTAEGKQVKKFVNMVESVELSCENPYEASLHLTLKEKDRNILQIVCDEGTRSIKEYLNS